MCNVLRSVSEVSEDDDSVEMIDVKDTTTSVASMPYACPPSIPSSAWCSVTALHDLSPPYALRDMHNIPAQPKMLTWPQHNSMWTYHKPANSTGTSPIH